MKKSQIILGATAFILAIASAFTSKAKSSTVTRTFFTKSGQQFTIQGSGCITSGSIVCTIVTGLNHHKVFGQTSFGGIETLKRP